MQLDRRLTIQRHQEVTGSPDEYGAPVLDWVDVATVWAQVTPIRDAERWEAAQVAAMATHRFVIRFREVDAGDRLIYEGKTFDISGVKEIGRRRYQEITASARAD